MANLKFLMAIALLSTAAAGSAFAQDAASDQSYPEACRSEVSHAGHGGPAQPEPDMSAMNEHQRASMQGMAKMDRNMMQGMMKEDADIAFVCGMIAHHQGAIDMSQVELEYGDDAWAKEMAQKIIDAQMLEITEMTKWLEENAE